MASNEPPGSTGEIGFSLAASSEGTGQANGGYTYQHATMSIVVAMGVNFTIALFKLFGWWLTRSSAMLSEALHSAGDGVNSIALLIGIRLSSRGPDRTHPFGYGLEASVWAILACAFLVVLAGFSIYEGVSRFSHPEVLHYNATPSGLDPFMVSVVILLASVLLEIYAVKRASQAVLEEVGVESSNPLQTVMLAWQHIKHVVGPTTRFVFYEDYIALLGAIIALIAITMTHLAVGYGILPFEIAHWPDSIASILIGLMLVGMAVYLFIHNRTILTGTAVAPKTERKINELVKNIHGVSEVHDLKTIDRGPAGLTIHMKVEVDPDTMVKDVDDLTERIKEKLQSRFSNVSSVFIEVLADESDIEWGEKFNTLIEQGRVEGVLKPREEAILRNFHDFMEATAEDVMIPRTDVEAIEINTPLNEVADLMIASGHSRIPVYEDVMDEVKGIVFARDIFAKVKNNELHTPLSELVSPIDIFPENKLVSDLLEEFKHRKIQMAIVVDEHGGFAGLVTLEDLLEEIVGDLWNEFDDEALLFEQLSSTEILMSGKYDIEELNDRLNIAMPTDEFLTVGGYVFGTLGREPKPGDTIEFEDLKLTVMDMDGHRITTIKIESPVPFELNLPPDELVEQETT